MTGTIGQVEEFWMNGWKIRPCPDGEGFDLVHADERYHNDHLETAVAAAQRSARYSPEHIDTDASVIRLHNALKYTDFTQLVFRGQTVHQLIQRIEKYEKSMPSWAHGTPEDYDAWLCELTQDDQRLRFYQWIGEQAVREAVAVFKETLRNDPAPPEFRHYTQEAVEELLEVIDPAAGPVALPSALPVGRPFCDVSCHTHIDGGGRLPTCRLDSQEES